MNFAKLVNLAMDCEFGNAVANLAKWFAKLEMGFAKLAMRNFAKVIWQWVCEIGNGLRSWQCGLRNAQYPAATVPLLTASCCFSSCLQLHLISSTFPLIFH